MNFQAVGRINPDDAVEDDIQAITDLLGIISSDEENKKENPEDVGEVFLSFGGRNGFRTNQHQLYFAG